MKKLALVLVLAVIVACGCETKQDQDGKQPAEKPAEKPAGKGAEVKAPAQLTTISVKFLKKLEGHTGEIEALAFDPDGKTLVTAAPGDAVRVWDVKEGKQSASYAIKSETAVDIDMLPDGKITMLLHSGGGFGPGPEEEAEEKTRIVIWNPKDPDKTKEIEDNEIDFSWKESRIRLTCSRDGKYIASFCYVDKKDSIRIWNAEDLKQVKTFDWPVEPEKEGSRTTPPDRDGRDVLFSPDGSHLFVRTQAAFHRWKTGTFDGLKTFEMPSGVNAAMAFTADGSKLAYLASYSEVGVISLPEGTSGKAVPCFRGPHSLAFDANGEILFCGVENGELYAWNTKVHMLAAVLDLVASMPKDAVPGGSDAPWRFFTLSHDGRTLAVPIGKTVYLWSVEYAKAAPVEVKWPAGLAPAQCGKCDKRISRIMLQCANCGSALGWPNFPDTSESPEAPFRNFMIGSLYRNPDWTRPCVTEADAKAFENQWPDRRGEQVSDDEINLFKKIKVEVKKKGDDRAEIIMKNFPGRTEDIIVPVLKKDGKWILSMLESEFFRSRLEEGRIVKAKVALMNLMQGLYTYEARQGEYPDAKSMGELVKELAKSGYIELSSYPLNEKGELIDPWGNPYVFSQVSEYEYLLYSCGPNGKDEKGEGDDVSGR